MSDIDERPIDLSALDARADQAAWDALVRQTVARAEQAIATRPQSPTHVIAGWSRPLLAVAAVLVALLVPVEVALEARERRAEQVERLVTLSVGWGSGRMAPSAADLSRALVPETLP